MTQGNGSYQIPSYPQVTFCYYNLIYCHRLNRLPLISVVPPGVTLVARDALQWRESQIFVPDQARVQVLKLLHDHPLAGHFGITKTIDLVCRTFWWPDLEGF